MAAPLRDGRFVALAPLGEGTQGKTFDGVDKREGRPVAIKRFDVRGARAWKDVELAEREARVLRELHHPKLPAYVDHFEEQGALYLVMEKIEGESLAVMRKRGAVLSEDDVVRLLKDAADVLAYLHGRAPSVIHRDLKPGNVIRRPDGSFAFVDFGAVRDKLRPEGGSTVVGTFGFMAPEQFQGRALPASDVYSIGATALTMLTGVDPENLPHKGLGIDVRAALRGRTSESLIDVLEQMLEVDPDRRASAIAPLLDRFARPGRDSARRPRREHERRERRQFEREQRRRAPRPHGSMPWPVALVATVAIALAIPVVAVTLKLLIPLLFFILSIFFGRKNFAAATTTVRLAGDRAVEGMRRAQIAIQRGFTPPRAEEEPRVRVVQADEPRVRVAGDDTPRDAVAEAEREADELLEEERARKKR